MYSDDDLDSAVEAGAISAEAAEALRLHVAGRRQAPAVDEEYFRLVSGFNDIFVVLACGLLFVALGWIGSAWRAGLGGLLVAVAAWGLAEYFIRKRRMALPAIMLFLSFTGAVFAAAQSVLPDGAFPLAGFVAALAAYAHWRRFRVPISVAAGLLAAVWSVLMRLFAVLPDWKPWAMPLVFAAGALVFAVALRWDAADVARQTRRADVAFWLHLLAAPMLVHPVFSGLGMLAEGPTLAGASLVLAMYLAVALVSLWIDRRALMVSALGYVLYAFTQLLKTSGFVSLGFASTALIVGAALLFLSAFWHRSRAAVLPLLPAGWRRWVPAAH